MCLDTISALCRYLGLFQSQSHLLPSFADDFVEMDHSHDAALQALYSTLTFPPREDIYNRRFYNPEPQEEAARYATLTASYRGRMMTSNALLLSRVFIRHAKEANLAEQFAGKNVLKILDIGCGNALNLMGIFTYFGNGVRIEYTGVDLSVERINDCQNTYRALPHPRPRFICEDANVFLKREKKFDLILIQHPNIESPTVRSAMTAIFENADKALTEGGIIYTTIYYPSEVEYFTRVILPKLQSKGLDGSLRDNESTFRTKIQSRISLEVYAPERFTWTSQPYKKYELQNKPSASRI